MRRNILIIILLVVLGSVATGFYFWYMPHQNMQRATADLTVSAPELMTAFNNDESAANAKYLDKVVAVSGKLREAASSGDVTIVSLEAEDEMGAVTCELDRFSKQKRTSFTPGEQLTLKGICSGKTIDVVLVQCVVVE